MDWNTLNLKEANEHLKRLQPDEIVAWVLKLDTNAIVTTNFRPYESAILHAVTTVEPTIKVVWCDTGYNVPKTYVFANKVINQLQLNIHLYTPKQTKAYRDSIMGVPSIEDERHKEFTDQVKLEPFRRAFEELKPTVWFANLRKGQTAFRDSLDILSLGNDGILKVAPFYYYSDTQIEDYLVFFNLPNESVYFDPTKALENRECGLHI